MTAWTGIIIRPSLPQASHVPAVPVDIASNPASAFEERTVGEGRLQSILKHPAPGVRIPGVRFWGCARSCLLSASAPSGEGDKRRCETKSAPPCTSNSITRRCEIVKVHSVSSHRASVTSHEESLAGCRPRRPPAIFGTYDWLHRTS